MKKLIPFFLLVLLIGCTNKNDKGINGAKPVDVYLNLEKEGFITTKNLTKGFCEWVSDRNTDDVVYKVTALSSDVNSVETVKATAEIYNGKDVKTLLPFIKFVSSLPYKDSQPAEATDWVEENFNKDKAEKIIGDAKFTIFVPSKNTRMLLIEKAKIL